MSEWTKVEDELPKLGQNVIAVGTWWGEINSYGEGEYMGIGAWRDGYVSIDSDTYSTEIHDVTHWRPIPEHPND